MRVFRNFAVLQIALTKADDPDDYSASDVAPIETSTLKATRTTTTTTTTTFENGECLTKELDYFGKKAETMKLNGVNGTPCRKWNDIKPPLRKVDYLQEHHNFCRNPEIGGKRDPRGPWCFKNITLDSEIDSLIDQFKRTRNLKRKFWEYCFTEEEVEKMKKSPCKNSEICPGSYSGTVDRTISGYKCRCWSDVGLSIRPSDENTKKLLKERCGLERNFNDYHNYCRNVPQNFNNGTHDVWKFEDQPWCYLANAEDIEILGKNWQHCRTKPEYSAAPFNPEETEKSTEECLNVEY